MCFCVSSDALEDVAVNYLRSCVRDVKGFLLVFVNYIVVLVYASRQVCLLCFSAYCNKGVFEVFSVCAFRRVLSSFRYRRRKVSVGFDVLDTGVAECL